jgi:hypothetical protein
LSNLSDKELLEMLSSFPKHELTTGQRTKTLKRLSEYSINPRKRYNFHRIALLAAVFLFAIISPIMYLIFHSEKSAPRAGMTGEQAQTYHKGEYFSLEDQNGTPLYANSNYGIPNKVSLLAPKEWVAGDNRNVAKLMVFLWGKELDLTQDLNVDAIYIPTGFKKQLGNTPLSKGMYGADASALMSFQAFDLPGEWSLNFTVEGKTIGTFTVHVKKPYILIGKSTLLISEEDLHPGTYHGASIEVEGDHLPAEIGLELFSTADAKSTVFTFKNKTDFTTVAGKRISMYTGDFQIANSGKYRFSVMKKSQAVNVIPALGQNSEIEGYVIMKGTTPFFIDDHYFGSDQVLADYIYYQIRKEHPSNAVLKFKHDDSILKQIKTGDRLRVQVDQWLESAPAQVVVKKATIIEKKHIIIE